MTEAIIHKTPGHIHCAVGRFKHLRTDLRCVALIAYVCMRNYQYHKTILGNRMILATTYYYYCGRSHIYIGAPSGETLLSPAILV